MWTRTNTGTNTAEKLAIAQENAAKAADDVARLKAEAIEESRAEEHAQLERMLIDIESMGADLEEKKDAIVATIVAVAPMIAAAGELTRRIAVVKSNAHHTAKRLGVEPVSRTPGTTSGAAQRAIGIGLVAEGGPAMIDLFNEWVSPVRP